MSSLFDYENFKSDFKQILSEGENLGTEEQSLISLFVTSNNPKSLLGLVRELKEEGNSLFKEKKIEEALEKYGYAGVMLARFDFELEEDKEEFFGLALCLLSNLAACLGRKNEFENVGQICTLILDYDPNNVKALFRRANVARKLGRNDLALWDLLLAAKIEPSNGEISKELVETKYALNKDKQGGDRQGDGPVGLGISLNAKRKPGKKQGTVQSNVQNQICRETSPTTTTMENKHESKVGKEVDCVNDSREACSSVEPIQTTDDLGMMSGDYKDEGMVNDVMELEDVMSSAGSQGTLTDSSPVLLNNEDSNLAKPKYQFYNRRRKGSFLHITKRDYLTMAHGRTLQFYNAKLGSYMQVRVVQQLKERPTINNGNLNQGEISSTSKLESKLQSKEEEEVNASMMEGSCDPNSSITNEANLSECVDYSFPPPCVENGSSTSPYFRFISKDTCKAGLKRFHAKARGSAQGQVKCQKKRRLLLDKNSSLSHTNHSCGCRFNVARKRKCVDLPSMNVYHPPRKKMVSYSCTYGHSSIVDVGCASVNFVSSGSVSFEMALGQSKRDK